MPGAHASFIGSVTGPKLAFRQPVAFFGPLRKTQSSCKICRLFPWRTEFCIFDRILCMQWICAQLCQNPTDAKSN